MARREECAYPKDHCAPASFVVVSIVVTILALALAAGSRAAAKPPVNRRTGLMEPLLTDLVSAVSRSDRAAVERLSARIGAARLAGALRSSDAEIVSAALEGVTALPGAVRLAEAVADVVESKDPALAGRAARVVGRLLDGAAPAEIESWGVPRDAVDRACGSMRRLAARVEAPTAVRLQALDAVAESSGVCTATGELAPLLRDPDPAVRRAAALTLTPSARAAATAVRDLLQDPAADVASAASAAVCRALPAGVPVEPTALDSARRLVVAATTPPEDAVEMLGCLAASNAPADKKLLEDLRRGPAGPIRDRAAELLGGRSQ